jgi:glutathione S-transferase
MAMKLYADPDSYIVKKLTLAATYSGLDVQAVKVEKGFGVPVLETDKGCIFSSGAIARYIARLRRDLGLYGHTLYDSGCVDSWIEFSTHQLEVPLGSLLGQADGSLKLSAQFLEKAQEDLKKALKVMDAHLLSWTYMVCEQITLADIYLCCAIAEGFKKVIAPEVRSSCPNLMRWFNTCMAQPEFKQVLGKVELSGGTSAAPKKEAAPTKDSEKKAPAPKKEPAAKKEPAPKKEAKKEAEPKKEASAKKEGKKDKKAEAPTDEKKEPTKEDKEKKIKKVIKEGGKRGVEIEGAADMGGLAFFCTSVDEPDGDLELLEMCMTAMNAKSDPTDEERKGGSGNIGKMIFSAGDKQLAICAYVPESKKGECDAKEWLQKVLDLHGGSLCPGASDLLAKGFVTADHDKNKFPLKMKEPSITEAITFLKKKGLFPDKDDDSDEDFVFGDDDFPS